MYTHHPTTLLRRKSSPLLIPPAISSFTHFIPLASQHLISPHFLTSPSSQRQKHKHIDCTLFLFSNGYPLFLLCFSLPLLPPLLHCSSISHLRADILAHPEIQIQAPQSSSRTSGLAYCWKPLPIFPLREVVHRIRRRTEAQVRSDIHSQNGYPNHDHSKRRQTRPRSLDREGCGLRDPTQ